MVTPRSMIYIIEGVDTHGLTPAALKRYCHIHWHSPPRSRPGSSAASHPGTRGALARVRNLLFSSHGEREGEAHTALPKEGRGYYHRKNDNREVVMVGPEDMTIRDHVNRKMRPFFIVMGVCFVLFALSGPLVASMRALPVLPFIPFLGFAGGGSWGHWSFIVALLPWR